VSERKPGIFGSQPLAGGDLQSKHLVQIRKKHKFSSEKPKAFTGYADISFIVC
jgi:hypothetical protein